MAFSYLEPVLHKAQLVLGGGLRFAFFSYSFPRAVATSGTKHDPLECPQTEAVPGRPLRLHRWRHSDTKEGATPAGCSVQPAGSQGAPGRCPELLPNPWKHSLDVFFGQKPTSLSNYARHATPSRRRARIRGSNRLANRRFKALSVRRREWMDVRGCDETPPPRAPTPTRSWSLCSTTESSC